MRPAGRPWSAWPLVVLSALPVVGLVLVARQVLSGETTLFGPVPSGDLPFRERAGLLLNVAFSESQLVVPLLALALLAWLARPATPSRPPAAALWAGSGVALLAAVLGLGQCLLVGYLVLSDPPPADEGFAFPRASLVELFGTRAASALLLAALAGALTAVLVAAARRTEPAEVELLDDEPVEDRPEPGELPRAADGPPAAEPVAPTGDPHERFRRPS